MSVQSLNSALRRVPTWPLYIGGAVPAGWWFWQALSGALGADPIAELEHLYGLLALQLLIASLLVTPLRRFVGVNLIRFRRMLGLLAFFYIGAHLAVWLLLDIRDPARILADILKRPYITIGMTAFVLLIPLAATSFNRAIRKLGPAWRKLHTLVYPAAILAGIHYVMIQKVWEVEPLLYMGAILALLAARVRFSRIFRPGIAG